MVIRIWQIEIFVSRKENDRGLTEWYNEGKNGR